MASPVQITFSPSPPSQPAAMSNRHVAGVASMKVALRARSSASRRLPSAATSRDASTMRAPTVNGRMISEMAMSNDSVVTASTTSSAVMPGSRCTLISRFTVARCGSTTPLGRPVEPDV